MGAYGARPAPGGYGQQAYGAAAGGYGAAMGGYGQQQPGYGAPAPAGNLISLTFLLVFCFVFCVGVPLYCVFTRCLGNGFSNGPILISRTCSVQFSVSQLFIPSPFSHLSSLSLSLSPPPLFAAGGYGGGYGGAQAGGYGQQAYGAPARGGYGAPAPTPPAWSEHATDDGTKYWYNAQTGESTWTKPAGM